MDACCVGYSDCSYSSTNDDCVDNNPNYTPVNPPPEIEGDCIDNNCNG